MKGTKATHSTPAAHITSTKAQVKATRQEEAARPKRKYTKRAASWFKTETVTPAVQAVHDQVAKDISTAKAKPVTPKAVKAKATPKVATKVEAKVKAAPAKTVSSSLLTQTFMNGSFKGQVDSIYRDRTTNPAKAHDFVSAINSGAISLPSIITKAQQLKLSAIGFKVDDSKVAPQPKRGRIPAVIAQAAK